LNTDELLDIICKSLKSILGDKACFNVLFNNDVVFSGGLGITSYEYMQLIFNLEKDYNLAFDNEIWEYNKIITIGDLMSYIHTNKICPDCDRYINNTTFLFHKVIEYNSEHIPNKVAIISDFSDGITYKQLWLFVKDGIAELEEQGLHYNDSILFYLPNSLDFIVNYFACAYLGLRIILCDIKLIHELIYIINENNVTSILVDDKTIENIRLLKENHILCCNILRANSYILKSDRTDIALRNYKIDENDISIILYTSGSEGRPKGVANSYKNITESIKNYCRTIPFNKSDKFIAAIPFYHSYGMGSCLLAGLASGSTLIIMSSFQPEKVLNVIEKMKATVFHGVPYMYKMLNYCLSKAETDLSSLRLCINASSKLNLEDAKKFYDLTGIIIHQEYGSTETGTIAFYRNYNFITNLDCVGEPLLGVVVNICNPDDKGIGKIAITSNAIALGYINTLDFSNVNYVTGDIGYFDKYGRIILLGREKRFINITGIKINAYEVENVICNHPKVKMAYVFGIKNSYFGEAIKALVVKEDSSLSKEELITYCKSKLTSYKVPTQIEWCDQLDLTQLGKATMNNQY